MTIRHVFMTLLLAALALSNVASSCSTVNNYPPSNHPPDHYPPDGGYGGGGYNSRTIITEGTGRLSWNADQNGEVYVYNSRENRLVFNGPIRRGDQIAVEPGNDRILMNNQVVFQQNLQRDDRHQIAFERAHNNYPSGPVYPPGPVGGNGHGNYPWYRDGVVITEGDDRLAWNCDQSGQVYVYDYGEDKLVWNGAIQRGQRIEVIPGQDLITIDGRNVYNQNLRKNARHQIVLVRVPGDQAGHGGTAPVIPDPIPNGTRLLVAGTGNISIGEAPGDGRVFVYDETDKHMLYDTQIEKNNSFQIFPSDNYVNLNSKKRADVRFIRGHRHALYFRAR